jgi:hypothetical protein
METGDRVKIVDSGYVHDSWERKAADLKLKNWQYGVEPENGSVGVITHTFDNGCVVNISGQDFIMSPDGLELFNEKEKPTMNEFRIFDPTPAPPKKKEKPKAFFKLEIRGGDLLLKVVDADGDHVVNLLFIDFDDGCLHLLSAAEPDGYDLEDILQFDVRGRLKVKVAG